MTLPDTHPTAANVTRGVSPGPLVDQLQLGLDSHICLTWELTYACNLACVHCVSNSGLAVSALLIDPIQLAGRTAPTRVLFGPHETNRGTGARCRAGGCVAPRTILEAVLEGRRRALDLGAGRAELAGAPAPAPAL
ncbi:MAG: mftC [Gemmatimonadales bacterium]|jgi:hypothetical protein|nr:mftC [Gemmatimonadales bacterium]